MSTVLVVGARKNSIGEAVQLVAESRSYDVRTVGLNGEEFAMDLVHSSMKEMAELLVRTHPMHVVCTVGINIPEPGGLEDPAMLYDTHFRTNVIGPMRLLLAWQALAVPQTRGPRHFVAISSNSARLPRSHSAPYCASKAALSMALRVKAREGAASGSPFVVYGYEPGLVANTPMTADTVAQFGHGVPLTRMRDPRLAEGIPADSLARLVVSGLIMGYEMNGMLIPLDADEA